MPGQIEMMHDAIARRDAETRCNPIEVAPMQHVELAERNAPGAHFIHGRLILVPPGIRKGKPVKREAERLEDRLGFACNAASPIDQRPEHIEEEGARDFRRRSNHEPAGSMPFSFMAATALASPKALISALTASALAE